MKHYRLLSPFLLHPRKREVKGLVVCCVVDAVDDVGRPFAPGCCLDPRLGLSLLTVDCISPDMHTWSSMSRDYSFRCVHEKKMAAKKSPVEPYSLLLTPFSFRKFYLQGPIDDEGEV